jgi:hypothetical protein
LLRGFRGGSVPGQVGQHADGRGDLGINAMFGAEFLFGSVRPFVEAQYSPVFSAGNTTSLYSVKGGLLVQF